MVQDTKPREHLTVALITEAVIEGLLAEAGLTRRAQMVGDSRCPGLRFVATGSKALWVLWCYDWNGRLQRRLLGTHPRMQADEARRTAWARRLQIRRIPRKVKKRAGAQTTLEELFFLYEDCCGTSQHWGRLKDKVFSNLPSFGFVEWNKVDLGELQTFIDNHPHPATMNYVVDCVNKVTKWAADAGLVRPLTGRLIRPLNKAVKR